MKKENLKLELNMSQARSLRGAVAFRLIAIEKSSQTAKGKLSRQYKDLDEIERKLVTYTGGVSRL